MFHPSPTPYKKRVCPISSLCSANLTLTQPNLEQASETRNKIPPYFQHKGEILSAKKQNNFVPNFLKNLTVEA